MLPAVVAVAVAMATVKLNKQVSEKVRELNALGTFLTDVRLGAVARKLSELPMEKALEVLQSVVDAAEGGDESAQQDPTMAVIEAGCARTERPLEYSPYASCAAL